MGRVWPQRRRRPCAVHHQTLSARATTAIGKIATRGKDLAATSFPLRLECSASSSPQCIRGLSRTDVLSIKPENEAFPILQQRPYQPEVSIPQEPQVFDQEQQRYPRKVSTVAFHTRSAEGSALPIGGAAGAAEGGVIPLFRDRYGSNGFRARSSLPAYSPSVYRVRGRSGEYTRSSYRGSDAEERRLLHHRTASSGSSRIFSPPRFSRAEQDERLNNFRSSFNKTNKSSTGTGRRELLPPPAKRTGAPSTTVDNTAANWPLGTASQSREKSDAKKSLRVSFATDLPLQRQHSTTPSGKLRSDESRAADVERASVPTTDEERQFLLYGFGRTSRLRSDSAQNNAASAAPAKAATTLEEGVKSSTFGWKLPWPSTLRRKRSKEIPTQVCTATDNDQLLLKSYAPSLSTKVAPRGRAASEPTRELAVTQTREAIVDPAAAGDNRLTPVAQKNEIDAAADTSAEVKAKRSFGGLQRIRQRLAFGREHAVVPLLHHQQQLRTVERPSSAQPFLSTSSQLRSVGSGTAGCGYNDDSSGGQPFSSAGIGYPLLTENDTLPSVSLYSSHGVAAAKEELVFAAEGGGTAAVSAHTGGRTFWWRAEARASRTVGCSKGFAGAWQHPLRERENTQLQQLTQGQQQQFSQQVPPQVLQQQQSSQEQEQQFLQQQQVLQRQQQEVLQQQQVLQRQQVRQQQVLQQQQQILLQQQQVLQQQQGVHHQSFQQPHRVAEQILLSKKEKLCLQQKEGFERTFQWQPEQPVWKGATGESASVDTAETSSQEPQNAVFGFSFSLRQEKQTYLTAQRESVYGNDCQPSYPAAGKPPQQSQQQVLDLRLQQEQGVQKQRSRQEQSRLQREQRLQQQLTVHRRVPSIRSTNGSVGSQDSLRQLGSCSLGFAAFSKKEEERKFTFSSPLSVAEAQAADLRQTSLVRHNSSSNPSLLRSLSRSVSAEAQARGRVYWTTAGPAATQPSSAENFGDACVYAAARRSTVLVGFTGAAAASADRYTQTTSAGAAATVWSNNARAGPPTVSFDNGASSLHEQSRHRLGSSFAASRTSLPPIAAGASNSSPLMLPSAVAADSPPVAAPPRPPLGGEAAAASPVTAAHTSSFAAGGASAVEAVVGKAAAAAVSKQTAIAAGVEQKETAGAASASVERAVSVREVAARTTRGRSLPPLSETIAAEINAPAGPATNVTAESGAANTRKASKVANGIFTRRSGSAHARRNPAALALDLPVSQHVQQQPVNRSDRGGQGHVLEKQLLQLELPREGQQAEGKLQERQQQHDEGTQLQQLQKREGEQQRPQQEQEASLVKKGVTTKAVGVVDGDDWLTRNARDKFKGSLAFDYSRQQTTTTAEATTFAIGTAATPTAAGQRRKQSGSGARRTEAGKQEGIAVKEQTTAGQKAEEVEQTTDSSDRSTFGHKTAYDSSVQSELKKASQGLDTQPHSSSYSVTDGRECSRTALTPVGNSFSSSQVPQRPQTKRGKSMRLMPLPRIVSGCCRTPVFRTRSEDEQQRQLHQRRRDSSSSNSSSNRSSNSSTSSSSSSSTKYHSGSIIGDEWGHKSMRFFSLSSLTSISRHGVDLPISKTESPLPAKAAGTPAPAATLTSLPQETLEGGEGRGGAAAAAAGGAAVTETEENSGTSVLLKRRSSKFHAVFSSIASVVRRGRHSLGLPTGTRKSKRQVTKTSRAAEAAATAFSTNMASTGNQQLAPAVSSLPTAEEGAPSHFGAEEDFPVTDSTAAYAAGDEEDELAARRKHGVDGREGGGGHEAAEYLGRKRTVREEQRGAERKVSAHGGVEREGTDTGVLKCYSLPMAEDTYGHRDELPEAPARVLSLDSQNSSVLSCHSFSSSSSSDSNIKVPSSAATATGRAAVQRHPSHRYAHGQRERETPERAAESREEDDAEDAGGEEEWKGREEEERVSATGEEQEEEWNGREGEERIFATEGENEDVEGGEVQDEGSISTAGDPNETAEGEETGAAETTEYDATAAAEASVEAFECVVDSTKLTRGEEDVPGEVREEVEVGLVMGRRARLQTERGLDDLEADAARHAVAGERAAERAAAKRIAAEQAALDLAEAQRTAAVRARQAEAAAARAAVAREELVQVAAAAGKRAAGSERAEVGADAQEEEATGELKVHGDRRRWSLGSIRRRSTASSTGSAAPVVVEARGDRLVRGKREIVAVAAPSVHATAAREIETERIPLEGETIVRRERSRASVGEARTVQPASAAAEERRHSWEPARYASQVRASEAEFEGPVDRGVEEVLPWRAATAAVAARAAKRASAAAVGAEDAAAAAAAVADAKAREAQAAEEEAEEAAAAADAVQAAADVAHARTLPKESIGDVSPGDDYEPDVSELRRYATEFLLEEAVEEPASAVVAAAPAPRHGGGKGREALRRLSSSAARSRQQRPSRHHVVPAHAQLEKNSGAISSSTGHQQQHPRQRGVHAGGQHPARRRSQVLSREEELAAMAGEAPHLIEEDEDGAAVLARKAELESRNRRGSSRFALSQLSRGNFADTAAVVAVQTAAAATSDTAAAAGDQGDVEPVSRGVHRGRHSVEGEAALEERPPLEHHYASRGVLPKYRRRVSSVQEEQRRFRHTGSTPARRHEDVSAVEGGDGGMRRRQFSAVEASPRHSWSTLAQVRAADRRPQEEAEAAEKRRDIEDDEKEQREQHKDLLHRRSTQEKNLVKRLLRHRTLQSPLLTVPPPFNLQNSPVLQAVYSKGDGGAAEAVVRASSEQSRRETRD